MMSLDAVVTHRVACHHLAVTGTRVLSIGIDLQRQPHKITTGEINVTTPFPGFNWLTLFGVRSGGGYDVDWDFVEEMLDDGGIYAAAWPLSAWAQADKHKHLNREILGEATGLSITVECPAKGPDGSVCPLDIIAASKLASHSDGAAYAIITPPANIRLEIGSFSLETIVMELWYDGSIALFPYKRQGVSPHLFILHHPKAVKLSGIDRRMVAKRELVACL